MIKVGNTGILLEIVVIANSVTVQDFDQSIKRVKKSSFLQWTVNIYHCVQMPEIASLQICGQKYEEKKYFSVMYPLYSLRRSLTNEFIA